jgi:serine protease Do
VARALTPGNAASLASIRARCGSSASASSRRIASVTCTSPSWTCTPSSILPNLKGVKAARTSSSFIAKSYHPATAWRNPLRYFAVQRRICPMKSPAKLPMKIALWPILLTGLLPAALAEAAPPMPPDMAALAARLLPSVVSVASTDPMSNDDSGAQDGAAARGGLRPTPVKDITNTAGSVIPPPKAEEALGSGFIIDTTGYIVTNNHVIDGATSVTVTLNDGTILPATVIGQDRRGDLAVLKVAAGHRLPAVQFGDINENKYDDFIQTDATINRGNSGGPLFDLAGQVIGINSAIYSPSGGSVGIGFAIPSAMVRPIVESLRAHGTITRGWLGVSAQDVTPEIVRMLRLPASAGALIGGVTPGSPADKKLEPGDVLVALGDAPITNTRSLMIRTAQILSGQTANAQFYRNGSLRSADITIAPPPADLRPGVAPALATPANITLSAIGTAVSPAASPNGLTVVAVTAGGPAAKAGLVADNTIAAVGASLVTSPGILRDQLNDLQNTHQPVAVLLVSGYDATGNDPGPRWLPVTLGK